MRVSVDGDSPMVETAPDMLNINIDAASLYPNNGYRLNFSDPRLIALARTLAREGPSRLTLRIGGSSADSLGFNLTSPVATSTNQLIQVDESYFDSILSFVDRAGLYLIWDLNGMGLRSGPGDASWNSTNARAFFAFLRERKANGFAGADRLTGFQLGNEPGHWQTNNKGTPSASAHAMDFSVLRSALRDVFGADAGSHYNIIGPDVCFTNGTMGLPPRGNGKCANVTYFEDLLGATKGALDFITVHSYGLHGEKNHSDPESQCDIKDFLSPDNWESKWAEPLSTWIGIAKATYGPDARVVLGETATAGDGGCKNLSNTFAAGFFWLDQLGGASRLGLHQVFRQDLVGWSGVGDSSSYALAGDPGWSGSLIDSPLTANPDYFTTRLWRRLCGARVLRARVTGGGETAPGARFHVTCRAGGSNGEVIAAFINPHDADLHVEIDGVAGTVPRDEFFLTAGPNITHDMSLSSRQVRLNGGRPLKFDNEMVPRRVAEGDIVLPAYSYGFLSLDGAMAPACMGVR